MIGTRIVGLYEPSIAIDPLITSDTWGDYITAFNAVLMTYEYEGTSITLYSPPGFPTSSNISLINTSDSVGGVLLKLDTVWNIGTPALSNDFSLFTAVFSAAGADPAVVATLNDFDTGNSMSFVKTIANLWSNEVVL